MIRLPLRALLLDLDGTLHDKTASDARVAARQFDAARLVDHGIASEAWVAAFIDMQRRRITKPEAFERLRMQFDLPTALTAELLENFETKYGESAVAFPGAHTLLAAARAAGLKLGVVTNGRDQFQRSKLAGLGFTALVDCVVTSGGCGVKKPDRAIFRACLAGLGAAAEHTACIGDDLQLDIEPAARLGMLAIWKSRETSPLATFCRDDLDEIRRFVLSLA